MATQKITILLAHSFVGWILCAATMGISMAVTSPENALIVHAIIAPVLFVSVSSVYFRMYSFTSPLQTAAFFLVFVMTMNFLVVTRNLNGNFEMSNVPLATWIPLLLIFVSTLLTGLCVQRRRLA